MGEYPFPNALALELGDRPKDVHLELAGRRRRVDPLGQTDDRDAEGLQLVEQRDQMPQVPPEPIQAPADQRVEPAPTGVGDQGVEGRPAVLAPADAPIDVFRSPPAPRLTSS